MNELKTFVLSEPNTYHNVSFWKHDLQVEKLETYILQYQPYRNIAKLLHRDHEYCSNILQDDIWIIQMSSCKLHKILQDDILALTKYFLVNTKSIISMFFH